MIKRYAIGPATALLLRLVNADPDAARWNLT